MTFSMYHVNSTEWITPLALLESTTSRYPYLYYARREHRANNCKNLSSQSKLSDAEHDFKAAIEIPLEKNERNNGSEACEFTAFCRTVLSRFEFARTFN